MFSYVDEYDCADSRERGRQFCDHILRLLRSGAAKLREPLQVHANFATDVGGVRRELVQVASEALFNDEQEALLRVPESLNMGFEEGDFLPSPRMLQRRLTPAHVDYLHTVGALLGVALNSGVSVDACLPAVLLRRLQQRNARLSWSEVQRTAVWSLLQRVPGLLQTASAQQYRDAVVGCDDMLPTLPFEAQYQADAADAADAAAAAGNFWRVYAEQLVDALLDVDRCAAFACVQAAFALVRHVGKPAYSGGVQQQLSVLVGFSCASFVHLKACVQRGRACDARQFALLLQVLQGFAPHERQAFVQMCSGSRRVQFVAGRASARIKVYTDRQPLSPPPPLHRRHAHPHQGADDNAAADAIHCCGGGDGGGGGGGRLQHVPLPRVNTCERHLMLPPHLDDHDSIARCLRKAITFLRVGMGCQ